MELTILTLARSSCLTLAETPSASPAVNEMTDPSFLASDCTAPVLILGAEAEAESCLSRASSPDCRERSSSSSASTSASCADRWRKADLISSALRKESGSGQEGDEGEDGKGAAFSSLLEAAEASGDGAMTIGIKMSSTKLAK